MDTKGLNTRCFMTLIFVGFSLLHSFAQGDASDRVTGTGIEFERVELPGGTSGNSVQAIVQDSLGYMWFGSQDGLHRYDGKNFITYHADPINQNTLNSDYIEDIYLDSNGIIWLTHWSGGGLTAYNPDQDVFTRYINKADDPESILMGETGTVIEGPEGDIWVGGPQGLSRLDRESGKFRRYAHNPADPTTLSDNMVRGLYVDSRGTLWIATGNPWSIDGKGGLNRYDPVTDSFERFMHIPGNPSTLSNNKVRAMLEDSQGNFWVGTAGNGLHLFDRDAKAFTQYPYDPENPQKLSMPFLKGTNESNAILWSHISSIFEDQSGRLWISAVGGGLNVYDPKSGVNSHYEAVGGENTLRSNFVWQTYQSNDGTIWVTTAGEGREVYKLKEEKFSIPFFHYEELRDSLNVMRGILKDPDENIWVAQSTTSPDAAVLRSKLWKIDKNRKNIIQVPLDPESANPNLPSFLGSISFDADGNIWAGTREGYYIGGVKDTKFKKFTPAVTDTEAVWVAPILQARDGAIWIPYWGHGVIRYDPKKDTYEVFEHDPANPNSISGPFAWALYEDESGVLWVGGGNFSPNSETPLFLDRFDPVTKTFEPYITSSLPYGIVTDITKDREGHFWFIDANYGLYKLNPDTRQVRRLTSTNSLLPGSKINSIFQHPGGNIWLSTDYELVELDPIRETFSVYDDKQGVRAAFGTTHGGYMTENGELLFARWEGFNAFNPKSFVGNMKSKMPDLRITGFRLLDNINGGVSGHSGNVLQEPIWKTTLIDLKSNENTFSFSVACFDFYQPESNRLQFMLEGYDRGWRGDVKNGETPLYINIPPGEYTFRLRGANGLGVWNTEGIRLNVVVHPPWWQTWWAITLYAILFIAAVFATHKIQRGRVILNERRKAQKKELEQAREIEKAYKQLKITQEQLILSEKMASLGELTAGIAHEIQNPLNFVNNFSEVNRELIEELKEERAKTKKERDENLEEELLRDIDQNLEKIAHHGKRADSIVKGMLQHSRASSGEMELTDINVLADEYLRLAYHGLRAKDKTFNAELNTDFDPTIGKIEIVPQDMGRVILNLITNAFHAVKDRLKEEGGDYKPTVSIRTRIDRDYVRIEVSDNGKGIPKKIIKRIFEPFFTTKPSGSGTGLGLSMSYDIVTKGHQGELLVDSIEGEGTTFTVMLPAGTKRKKKENK